MNTQSNTSSTSDMKELDFKFTGSAKEYFGIWIVNILLSIITFGIYSAWAKVRTKRYFYGNTWLDGHNFEYHAKPLTILKGRIIVFVLIVAFNILANINPIFNLLGLLILIALPWLINAGLKFNARMSSYRNVRFDFDGNYWAALWRFILLPFLAMLPFGLLIPYSTKKRLEYYYSNHQFGGKNFHTSPPLGKLYATYFIALAIALVLLVVVIAASILFFGGLPAVSNFEVFLLELENNPESAAMMLPFILTIYVVLALVFMVPAILYMIRTFNIAVNGLSIDQVHTFKSDVKVRTYFWITISNGIVTLLTLGLMAPWAHVRKAKYILSALSVETDGDLSAFIDEQSQDGNVTASEYLDVEGIEFGI